MGSVMLIGVQKQLVIEAGSYTKGWALASMM
jgi:hypothetical protein